MDHEDREEEVYRPWASYAHLIKIYAQMCTGVIICLLLVLTAFSSFLGVPPCNSQPLAATDLAGLLASHIALHSPCSFLGGLVQQNTLAIVGDGLMYSAGFELAYMLFTPGLDEAIEPVILGMAATILIIISDDKIEWFDAVVPAALTLSIGFLFYLKKVFLPKHEAGAAPPRQARVRMVVLADTQTQPNNPPVQDAPR